MAHLRQSLGRLLVSLALLVAWLGVQVQAGADSAGSLDARALAARLLLCYVAAFWLQLGWQGLAERRAARPASLRAGEPAGQTGTTHQARMTE